MRRSFVAPISWGLGDLVVSLPAVQGLIRRGDQTFLVARSGLQDQLADRIPGLAGVMREVDFREDELSPGDRFYNLREHHIQKDYWWGSERFSRDFPGYRINDILKQICVDLEVPADFTTPEPLNYSLHRAAANKVLFVPGSDGSHKCWPNTNWLELFHILRSRSIDLAMLGQPDSSLCVRQLIESGLPWISTETLAEAVDAISSSRVVIGVDTGLTHVAVQQGRPTLALYRADPIYVRPYENCLPLLGGHCAPQCMEASLNSSTNMLTEFKDHFPESWQCKMGESERCLTAISTEMVIASLNTVLSATAEAHCQ